jgi:hypothetical protein
MKLYRAIYTVLVALLQVFLLLNCRNEVSKSHSVILTSLMTNIAFQTIFNGQLEYIEKRRINYTIGLTINIKT